MQTKRPHCVTYGLQHTLTPALCGYQRHLGQAWCIEVRVDVVSRDMIVVRCHCVAYGSLCGIWVGTHLLVRVPRQKVKSVGQRACSSFRRRQQHLPRKTITIHTWERLRRYLPYASLLARALLGFLLSERRGACGICLRHVAAQALGLS